MNHNDSLWLIKLHIDALGKTTDAADYLKFHNLLHHGHPQAPVTIENLTIVRV